MLWREAFPKSSPVRRDGRNDEVQVEGRIPVDGTIRSFGGRLPVFYRLRAAGPAKPWGGECRGPAHRRKVEPDRTRWPAGFVCAWTVGASVPRPKRAKRTVGFRGRMVCRGGVYARFFRPSGSGGFRSVRIVRGKRDRPVASARKFRPISLGRRAPEFV